MPKTKFIRRLPIRDRAQFILNNGLDVRPIINPQTMKLSWMAFCGKHEVGLMYEDQHECLTDNLALLRRQAGEGFEQTIIK